MFNFVFILHVCFALPTPRRSSLSPYRPYRLLQPAASPVGVVSLPFDGPLLAPPEDPALSPRATANSLVSPLYPLPPCHYNGGPADERLHCDASQYQMLYTPGSHNQMITPQKENLIILDIDRTIMDMHFGFHGPVPWEQMGYAFRPRTNKDLVLMFMQDPREYMIVFRKHFFEFLRYVHTNQGFSADLAIYTRGRPEFAMEMVNQINKFYHLKYTTPGLPAYSSLPYEFIPGLFKKCMLFVFISYTTH